MHRRTGWPSVILEKRDLEYAFALWCNSTLGLLLHWWVAKQDPVWPRHYHCHRHSQHPTLDVGTLTDEQVTAAKAAFCALHERRFLPFDQIDEDLARAELDRRLLVDVLGCQKRYVSRMAPWTC